LGIKNECSRTQAKIKLIQLRANFSKCSFLYFLLNRINIIARSVKTTFGVGSSRRGDEGPRALYRGAGDESIRDESIGDEPIGDEPIRDDPIGDEPS
jgi:hypothetical protein